MSIVRTDCVIIMLVTWWSWCNGVAIANLRSKIVAAWRHPLHQKVTISENARIHCNTWS